MPINILKEGIIFGMKENLHIQFVLPNYPLPVYYWHEMLYVDCAIIAPGATPYDELVPQNTFYQYPDVVVFDKISDLVEYHFQIKSTVALRINKSTFFAKIEIISGLISNLSRLNIIITDIHTFKENDFIQYKKCLYSLSVALKTAYAKGLTPQINLITDRMMLKEMNNCNAGDKCITLAPNGKFYICPAFYQDNCATPISKNFAIGSLIEGVNIKNSNLYKLEFSPLCRTCDAYQCKRCIWLNNKTTYEVNTPSHEQCVIAHLERNASRKLLSELREISPSFMEGINIKEICYLDPFEVKQEL